jgi:phospholipid-binding lipoprotein MlaA
MKSYLSLALLCAFLAMGCAHSQRPSSAVAGQPDITPKTVMLAANSGQQGTDAQIKPKAQSINDDENLDYDDDTFKEERVEIADPIEPFNRAIYHFNDKLYFWALKPVAQGYKVVVPEPARISVKNFFSNLGFPVRFLSCLLQADFSGAASEFGRFGINTIWGVGGLLDPSSNKELDLQKQETDLGQTLGVYGVGHGFYVVWPVLGPSSPRDTVDIAGDYFLYPVSYVYPWYAGIGVRSYEIVNSTSMRIGDYESLKEAAIDPYIALRDAYIQYRLKKVKARKARSLIFRTEETSAPAVDTALPNK